jgi:hypothetical protein
MKKISAIIIGFVLFFLNSSFAFADGSPYTCTNPYGCHVPIDTGLASTQFYILGAILFVTAIVLLLNVSAIRSKLNLD